jgi:serine/threonine protein kinase
MLCLPEMYGLRHGTPEFERAAEELLREARRLQSLRHDNIVTMHGVSLHPEHGHVQWLVTELADGGSLEAWLSARGYLTLAELVDLLRSVMRALVYLHGRTPAVLHRDVKPANVLVLTSPDGGVVWKLGDVGISKLLQSTLRGHTVEGTPMYMAADVLLGPYDGRVDVFSVGIMAANLVVRYCDIGGFERVDAGVYNEPGDREALVADACSRVDRVHAALSSVIRGCSAVKAKHRMSSDAALRALEALVVDGAASASVRHRGCCTIAVDVCDVRGRLGSRVSASRSVCRLSLCYGRTAGP